MDILASVWTVTVGVVLVILGFNALIVVHEWGHFIVARLCGVRCEKFYIWFDFWGLKFFKFKWGNTEYGLGLFPLGGYLKMLGQEDNPGAIQAEIERAKIQAQTADGKRQTAAGSEEAVTPPDLYKNKEEWTGEKAVKVDANPEVLYESPLFAPDSFLSKNIPQRLAIICAGVTMNFLFAIVCAAGAYMIGVKEETPLIGNVVPGSPAWGAGLQAGDRITAIGDKPAKTFGDVRMKMIEGNKTVQLTIDRQGETITASIAPRRRTNDLAPTIGIMSYSTLDLASGSVAPMWKKYYSDKSLEMLKEWGEELKTDIQRVSKITHVDGQAVENYTDYQEILHEKIGQPITCTFFHRTSDPYVKLAPHSLDIQLPAIPMRTIPVRFKMGAITAVLPDSDAAKQGIAPDDTLISVDGDAEIDPLKLPQILLRKVNDKQATVALVVKKASGEEQALTVALKPIRILPGLSGMSMRDPLGSTALGLSWNVDPIIAAVDESALREPMTVSPSVGDKVTSIEFVNCKRLLGKNSFSEATNEGGFLIHDIGSKIDIPYIFTYLLQETQSPESREPGEQEKTLSVRLTLEGSDGMIKIVNMPILDAADWFNVERGIGLKADLTIFKAGSIGEALRLGTARMVKFSLFVYTSVNALFNGTVSAKALNGPIGIVYFLYQIAQGGWSEYLMFLCLIGANLAVINLFPIPPLDGGLAVFALYEAVFRRPPNEWVQVILSYVGLFLILLLMVWTVALDITCIPRW